MESIIRYGCPLLLDSSGPAALIFLLLPALFAAAGARLLQGGAARIVGGAAGGAVRDVLVLVAAGCGWISVTNPQWEAGVSAMLVFFGASGGALGSCLAPYRGRLLLLNSALGGLLGQFALPFLLLRRRTVRTDRTSA